MKAVLAVVLLAIVAVQATELQAEALARAEVEAALGVELSAFHTPASLLETMTAEETVNTAPVACKTSAQFTDPAKAVEDGSGAKDYASNLQSCYVIKPAAVPAGSRVKLWFSNIDVEKNYDFVRVFDSATQKQLDDDADANTNYYSTGGFLIQFVTDQSVTKSGWKANWAVEAAGNAPPTTDEVVMARFPAENSKACNTQGYANDGHFVVRRGCTWKAGIDPSAVKAAKWRFRMTDVGAPTKHELACPGKSAYISCTANADGSVMFTFDVNAPVGIYDIDAVLADGKVVGDNVMAYVLFNPYNDKDQTYMKDATDRAAYLEANTGAVYTGDSPKAWNFGNGDMKVLKASFAALSSLSEAERGLAWRVAREISWVANNNVLHGRWDGKYSDGKQPGYWPGSDVILAQWFDSGKTRVKYGQCWVFSGVVSTISRSVGIPCMSHTNMNSAHEHPPFDQKCHRYWKKEGSNFVPDEEKNEDSVWNFHVWNAGWFSRPDLQKAAPAWNAYDGTCQEMSDGRCQMGPALLEDTKAGRFQAKYDQAFLAGETNCDIINMLLEPTSGKYSQHSVEDCTVGRNTWTFPKTGGMSRPQDVSSWYKTEPAKCNQRTSFLETGMRITHSHEASGVRFNAVAPPKTLVIGKPIVMGLDVVGATRGVAVTLRVQKVDSRDKKIKGTQADLWSYSVNVKGSQNVRQNVPLAKLAAALGETRSFRLLWSASVDGSKEGFMHQSTILLTPPPMRISSAQIQVGQVAKATVQWENPLPIALKCKFQYSIGDSGRNFPEVTFNVGKGGVLNHVIVVKTSKAGKIQGQATLSCDNLDEITGQFYVTAQPPPPRRLHRERRPGLSGRNKIGPERTNRLQPGTQVTAGARQSDRSSGTRTGHTNPAPQQPRRRRPGVPAQRFRQQNTDLAPMKATPLDPVSDVDQMEYEVAELL